MPKRHGVQVASTNATPIVLPSKLRPLKSIASSVFVAACERNCERN